MVNEIVVNKKIRILNKCNRCGHEWLQQSDNIPVKCYKCNSPYWNKARVRNIKKDNQGS